MKSKCIGSFFLWLFLPCLLLANTTELYPFQSVEKTMIFNKITSELRCLVCQNQSIADSSAPLAGDLRQVVYEQLQQGHGEEAVIAYLTERYGDYVRYKPPLNKSTTVLWWGPFLFFVSLILVFLCNQRLFFFKKN